jgi:hypothetical protein
VFVTVFSLLLSINFAQAGGSGRGPSFGGYHPFDRPIPDKPLDGAKQAVQDTGNAIEKTGKAVGPVIARPFEQTHSPSRIRGVGRSVPSAGRTKVWRRPKRRRRTHLILRIGRLPPLRKKRASQSARLAVRPSSRLPRITSVVANLDGRRSRLMMSIRFTRETQDTRLSPGAWSPGLLRVAQY